MVILLPAWPSPFIRQWSLQNSRFNSVISIVLFVCCSFKGGGRQVKDGGPLSYDALAKTLTLFLGYPYIWPMLQQVHNTHLQNTHTKAHVTG